MRVVQRIRISAAAVKILAETAWLSASAWGKAHCVDLTTKADDDTGDHAARQRLIRFPDDRLVAMPPDAATKWLGEVDHCRPGAACDEETVVLDLSLHKFVDARIGLAGVAVERENDQALHASSGAAISDRGSGLSVGADVALAGSKKRYASSLIGSVTRNQASA